MNKISLLTLSLILLFSCFTKNIIAQNEIWDDQFIAANAPNGTVTAMTTDGNNIYIGGNFTTVAGLSANYIAKWDGTTWSALGTGLDGLVRTIAIDGTNVYVGGDFTTAGGSAANYIAMWDGSTWSNLTTGTDGSVYSIMIKDGNTYVGGNFANSGGVSTNNISLWDGSAWSAITTGTNGPVYTIANNGVDIFVGGDFTDAGGIAGTNYIAKWDGSAWDALLTGTNDIVRDIIVSGTAFYACGDFTIASSITVNRITKWNGTDFKALGAGLDGSAYSIELNGSDLYVGGTFTTANAIPANNIAKYDGVDWTAQGDGADNTVYALSYMKYELHLGGLFLNAGNKPSDYFARIMMMPIVVTNPVSIDACMGDTVTFTVDAQGTAPITYQWQKDGSDIVGAVDTFLTINNVTPANDGFYKCAVTNAVGTVSSNQASLTVHTIPTITVEPLDSIKCEHESVVISISANSTLSATVQWQLNSSDILGATSSIYTITDLVIADAGDYICIVTNACGDDTSDIATLTVNAITPAIFTGLDTAYCIDGKKDTLYGSPVGGVFTGSGMTDSIFDPTGLVGIHTITYTYTNAFGCEGVHAEQFEGHTLPTVTFSDLDSDYCITDFGDTLTADPYGYGTFVGLGISNYVFYPDSAGVGVHQIVYKFTDKYGCFNADTNSTEVHGLPAVTVGADTSICIGDSIPITIDGDFGSYGWFFTPQINTTLYVQPTTTTSYAGWIMSSFGCVSNCMNPN